MLGGGASDSQNRVVTPQLMRRLLSDLKQLEEEPIPMAAARPRSDEDLTLWDGIISVEMDVSGVGKTAVKLHFLIDFPSMYPQSAPNIGFSFDFAYNGGAYYTMQDGRLKGKKVICLDLLGNFGNIHTEWQQEVGSGWSPAYTTTTLLVQLQSVLADLGTSMTQKQRDSCYKSALEFSRCNPSQMLDVLCESETRKFIAKRRRGAKLNSLCNGDKVLLGKVESFVKIANIAEDCSMFEEFVNLLKAAKGESNV